MHVYMKLQRREINLFDILYSHTQAASKHFMINRSHEVIVVMQLSPIYLDIMCAVHIRFRDITRLVR